MPKENESVQCQLEYLIIFVESHDIHIFIYIHIKYHYTLHVPMNVFRESRVKNASICSLTSVTVVVVVVVGDVVVVVVLENGAGVTMGGANRILLPRLEVPPRNDTNTGSDSCAFLTKDGFVADTTTVGGMIMVVVIIIHGSRMMIIVKRHGSIIMLENVLH